MHFNALRKTMRTILDSKISLELRSAPGRGKSQFVEDTVRIESERDGFQWGFATCFLATMTPPDLIGYVFKGERTWKEFNGGEPVPVSEPTMPLWMMTTEGKPLHAYRRGILFLDEYGQGEADVKRASAELLLNRRLGPWVLPEGWSVVAASNRDKDRSGVTKAFDFVINRRIEIDITDDIQSWEDWALKAEVDPTIIAFARENPQVVFTDGVPAKQGPWCTPRSLVMLSNLLNRMRDENDEIPTDAIANELACGMIGQAATAQLFATIKLANEMPKFDEIVKNPKTCRVPEKPDAQILIAYNLAARVDEKTAKPVVDYIGRLGQEFGPVFAKAACKRNGMILMTDAFDEWIGKNASIMATIHSLS